MPKVKPTRRKDEAWCSKCECFKKRSCFHNAAHRKNGLNEWCKDCAHSYEKGYALRRRELWRRWARSGSTSFWKYRLARNNVCCNPQHFRAKYEENSFCWYCGISLRPEQTHIDHRNPRSRGGDDSIANLVISCGDCNRLKHTRTEEEFRKFLDEYVLRFLPTGGKQAKAVQPERLSEMTPGSGRCDSLDSQENEL